MTTTAHESELARIRTFLAQRFPAFKPDMGLDEPLDRVIDSLGLFDLVEWIETTFGVRIPNEEFSPRRFHTLGAILRTIEEFRAA